MKELRTIEFIKKNKNWIVFKYSIFFFKFGNYGENYCPEIDWESARVHEKIDGSLIKLWFDRGKWHISTISSEELTITFGV